MVHDAITLRHQHVIDPAGRYGTSWEDHGKMIEAIWCRFTLPANQLQVPQVASWAMVCLDGAWLTGVSDHYHHVAVTPLPMNVDQLGISDFSALPTLCG